MQKKKRDTRVTKVILEKITLLTVIMVTITTHSFGITGSEFKQMKYSIFTPGMLENKTSVKNGYLSYESVKLPSDSIPFQGTIHTIDEDVDNDGNADIGYSVPWRKNAADREKYFTDVSVSTPYSTMDSSNTSVQFSQMFTLKLKKQKNFTFLYTYNGNQQISLLHISEAGGLMVKYDALATGGMGMGLTSAYIKNSDGSYVKYPVDELIQYRGEGSNPWVQVEVHITGASVVQKNIGFVQMTRCGEYKTISYKINGKQIYISSASLGWISSFPYLYNISNYTQPTLGWFTSDFKTENAAVAEVIALEGEDEATASEFFDRFRLSFIQAVEEPSNYYINNIYYLPPGDNSSVTISSQSVSSTSMTTSISGGGSVSAGIGLEFTPTVWSGYCGVSAEASITAAAEYNKDNTKTLTTIVSEEKTFESDGTGDQVEYQTLYLSSIFYGRKLLEEAFSDEPRSVDNTFVGSFIVANLGDQIEYASVEEFRKFANKSAIDNLNNIYLKDENGMVRSNHESLKGITSKTVAVNRSIYTYSKEKSEENSNSQSFSLDLATSATVKIIVGGVTASTGMTAHIGGSSSMTKSNSESSGISYTYNDQTAWDFIVAKYWELPNGTRLHQLESDDYTSAPVEPFTTPSVGFDYYVIEDEGDLTIPGEVVKCKLVIKTTSLSNAAKGEAYITDIQPTVEAQKFYDIAITSRKLVPSVGEYDTISFTCTLKNSVSNPQKEKVEVIVHYGVENGGVFTSIDYWEKEDTRQENPISVIVPSTVMIGEQADISASLKMNSDQVITLTSLDTTTIKIVNNKLIPISIGTATITATTVANSVYFGDKIETIVNVVEDSSITAIAKMNPFTKNGYSLKVAPTPTKDSGKLVVVSDVSGKATFTIFTTTERKRAVISKEITTNEELEFNWDVISKLQPDVYFIEMKINGDIKAIERIVKIEK